MRKTIHYTLMACTMLATFVRPGLAEEAPHIDGRLIPFKTSAPPPAPNGTLVPMPQPPEPAADDIEQAEPALANPTNKPITGAQELDKIVGGDRPLSLEALQNTRPNDEGSDGLKPGRKEALQEAAHIYGAQGGLAARSFAINEMLRRYEDTLDATFDFRSLVLPIGSGQTLMQPQSSPRPRWHSPSTALVRSRMKLNVFLKLPEKHS